MIKLKEKTSTSFPDLTEMKHMLILICAMPFVCCVIYSVTIVAKLPTDPLLVVLKSMVICFIAKLSDNLVKLQLRFLF